MNKTLNHEKHERHEKILYADECYAIQGAVFEVYREMGAGFLEAVYQECLEREFSVREISFRTQPKRNLQYKQYQLSQFYQADFICFDKIIIELKAVRQVSSGPSTERRPSIT